MRVFSKGEKNQYWVQNFGLKFVFAAEAVQVGMQNLCQSLIELPQSLQNKFHWVTLMCKLSGYTVNKTTRFIDLVPFNTKSYLTCKKTFW